MDLAQLVSGVVARLPEAYVYMVIRVIILLKDCWSHAIVSQICICTDSYFIYRQCRGNGFINLYRADAAKHVLDGLPVCPTLQAVVVRIDVGSSRYVPKVVGLKGY